MNVWILAFLIPFAAAEQTTVFVLDGDTIKIEQQKMRLYGIDAPEMSQPYGKFAAQTLTEKIKQPIRYGIFPNKDKYGRQIVLLKYRDQGTTVQARLILEGAAWVYPQYCTIDQCESWKRLERMARDQRRGLWADDNPVPPWEWRRR